MTAVSFISIVLFGCCFLHVRRASVFTYNFGNGAECPSQRVQCRCGRSGHVAVYMNRCLYSDEWGETYCSRCHGSISPKKICHNFRNCATCDGSEQKCVTCPSQKYGKLCKKDCECHNGAACSQKGTCLCTREYTGALCDTKRSEPLIEMTISCEPGYKLDGFNTIECIDGKWNANLPMSNLLSGCLPLGYFPFQPVVHNWFIKGRGHLITCAPITLDNANWTILSTDLESERYEEGSELTYQCNDGFQPVGPEKLVCGHDGQWEGGVPRCVKNNDVMLSVICPSLQRPPHGYITDPTHGEPEPGYSIEYHCEKNYYLVGNSTNHCTQNGKWYANTPRCVHVVTCKDPPVFKNMIHCFGRGCSSWMLNTANTENCLPFVKVDGHVVHLTPGLHPERTVVEYRCPIFYRLHGVFRRQCDYQGRWTGQASYCEAECGKRSRDSSSLIVNGSPTMIELWPWHVGLSRLGDDWNIMCGGSLISADWVVTAAHCVTSSRSRDQLPLKQLKVLMGKLYWENKRKENGVQQSKISEIVIHPNYNPENYDSDIALLRLKYPAELTNKIKPVCLSSDLSSDIPPSKDYVITGWGKTENRSKATALRMAKLQVTTQHECKMLITNNGTENLEITDNMLCAGNLKTKSNAASGDSGGPLVSKVDDKWYLAGIVSWSRRNETGGHNYGVYTRVQRFVAWISNVTNKMYP